MPEGPAPRGSESTPGAAERLDVLVRAAGVRALFERSAISQATVFVNSAIVAVVLWGHAPPALLLGWAGALWIVSLGRLALRAAFQRAAPGAGEVARWERWFLVGAAANGAVWGAAPLLVPGGMTIAHLCFLAFVLGGMVGGAALSNASRQRAFLAFAVPALLPMFLVLVTGGDRFRVGMGALVGVFGLAVAGISRSAGRSLAEAFRLRFENAGLAFELARINAGLEARVAERTAELDAARAREREVERRLANAARLATLGTLAGGVAHEINNPLTYLRSNVVFVREELARLQLDPQAHGTLDEALADAGEGVERVRRIVRHLMSLSRFDAAGEAHPVDLHAVLDLCADMVRPEVRSRARLRSEYGDVPRVLGDRERLVQVFLNLLLNAAQAVAEGDAARNEIGIVTSVSADGARVTVSISDTGCGIPEESLLRIWDPFFTTKPADQGVGLGLSICRSLVGALGGRISVISRAGEGSTFSVTLRAAAAGEPREPARGAEAGVDG